MNQERPLIFIVDGDTAVRESLKFALELEGLAIIGCATAGALLNHERLPEARCVILDGRSLGAQMFDVLQALKALALKVPVVLVVSNYSPLGRRQAAAAGAAYIIEKPFLDSTLMETVKNAIHA